jgi:hypothetical protein
MHDAVFYGGPNYSEPRGTEGSNPVPSCAESSSILDTSAANRLGVAAPLLAKVL